MIRICLMKVVLPLSPVPRKASWEGLGDEEERCGGGGGYVGRQGGELGCSLKQAYEQKSTAGVAGSFPTSHFNYNKFTALTSALSSLPARLPFSIKSFLRINIQVLIVPGSDSVDW